MPYVYSTATASASYCEYESPGSSSNQNASVGHNKIKRKVVINGGANLATKHLVTPRGVVTEVSDDDLEFLMKNKAFQRHLAAGFLSVDKKKIDPDKKAESMTSEDGSAPLTPKDFEKSNKEGQYSENAKIYKGTPKSKK